MNNARNTHYKGYEVFHINPSVFIEDVLYKKTNNNVCKKVLTPEKIKERQRQRQRQRKSPGRSVNSSVSSDSPRSVKYKTPNSSPKPKSESSNLTGKRSDETVPSKKSKKLSTRVENSKKFSKRVSQVTDKEVSDNKVAIEKSNPRRQSHYQKFFSFQDKIEKMKQDSMLNTDAGKDVDVTVMSLNVSNDNSLVKEESTKLMKSLNTSETTKEKGVLKNITQHYVEARTKFKTDVFANTSVGIAEDEMNTNSLKYINLQKTKLKPNESNSVNPFSSIAKPEEETNIKEKDNKPGKTKEKEVTFNPSLNIETNNLCFNVTDVTNKNVLSEMGDEGSGKFVQDMGINTIPFDELISLMQNDVKPSRLKTAGNETSLALCSPGAGDVNKSSYNDSKQAPKSYIQKHYGSTKCIEPVKIKKLSPYSHSQTLSQPKRTNESVTPRNVCKSKTLPASKSSSPKRNISIERKNAKSATRGQSHSPTSSASKSSQVSSDSMSKKVRTSRDKNPHNRKPSKNNEGGAANAASQPQSKIDDDTSKCNKDSASQKSPHSSKKTSIFHSSLASSRRSKSSNSCKKGNQKPQINTINSQPDDTETNATATPTKSKADANYPPKTTTAIGQSQKTKMSHIANRSKSNLSYRSIVKRKTNCTRPLTPNVEINTKTVQRESTSPLTRSHTSSSAKVHKKCNNTPLQPSSTAPVDSESSDQSDEQLETVELNTTTKKPVTKQSRLSSLADTKPYTKLINCKDSIEVMNKHKQVASAMEAPLQEAVNSRDSYVVQNPISVKQDDSIKTTTNKESKHNTITKKRPNTPNKSNLPVDKTTACEPNLKQSDPQICLCSPFKEPLVVEESNDGDPNRRNTNVNKNNITNKTRVFNKIGLKLQKPTPVHTWRY